ncbi:MAG: hypothetical protein COY58_05265 [Gammaproteobacteria bacterium CG_4_10_14_0_8_um_filter_38_16]|nr:MAG: hypothetical protein COY58_05265 [Gammaproteobacteria bacterium CG_4_10_14_0_8_um_filter_38_16]PJA02847.1 MAG: hypothetical protein COX72_08650 [Gammaproteobacteria bacterium CG_4_10_14_0_2_um_filter_38_22]PJB10304.1 MAG: hypothetical protein CO120_05530 [Gammaproteobacteria bacterium CG_4_9_14_3_um_filter_38_9]
MRNSPFFNSALAVIGLCLTTSSGIELSKSDTIGQVVGFSMLSGLSAMLFFYALAKMCPQRENAVDAAPQITTNNAAFLAQTDRTNLLLPSEVKTMQF